MCDPKELDWAINDGLVACRQCRDAPLAILNYTQRCQFERGAWNDTTRLCRGLIYRIDTEEVVARPFPKFFNYGQQEAPTLDLSAPASVTGSHTTPTVPAGATPTSRTPATLSVTSSAIVVW